MRFGFLIFLFLVCNTCFSQVHIENLILKNTSVKEMYKGLDNILKVFARDSTSNYVIKSAHSEVILHNKLKNTFRVRVSIYGIDTLKIMKNGQILKEEYFELKKVPDPVVFLFESRKKSLSVEQIESNPTLYCWPFEYNLKFPYQILSYDLIIVDKNGNRVSADSPNIGGQINNENLLIIKQQQKGALLFFENVRAAGPDRISRKLPALRIEII